MRFIVFALMSLLILLSLAWYININQLDIVITKDIHYYNRWRSDFENLNFKDSIGIERMRSKSLDLIDILIERKEKQHNVGWKTQLLLTITALTTFIITMLIIRFKRKKLI